MIEIAKESLISLHEIPQRLPPRRSGRPVHMSTVYRWIQRGVRGVRLEAVRIGGILSTSREALQRFAEQLSGELDLPAVSSRSERQLREIQLDSVHRRLGIAPEEQAETEPGTKP